MRLLLLSNSTLPGEAFFTWPRPHLLDFLGGPKRIAFVPFAAVTMSQDDYAQAVSDALAEQGHTWVPLHAEKDPVAALTSCDAVAVGGGNTFQLLRHLYRTGLIKAIADHVRKGMPYIGWSAGSNVAGPTIMTTNDMPITEVPSFRAMHLVPFQINPHYTEARVPGHGGESRDQRIAEFLVLHPEARVVGLREGALLRVEGGHMHLAGTGMRVFRKGAEPEEIGAPAELRTVLGTR
ncbi:MAG: dipeptidase PepE [Flavobacteriales bacterium]|nr:dipeptidase PepE [Flavobacteriales bacterium]